MSFSTRFYTLKRIIASNTLTRYHSLGIMTNSDIIEACKAAAAQRAVQENIDRDMIVGLGSGSTMNYVVKYAKELIDKKNYHLRFLPTSFQAKQLIYDNRLEICELDYNPTVDVTIDGADEVDENFVAIKGGGACLTQEKVVAFAAKKFVVVADYRKDSKHLGQNWNKGIPIEVLPMACNSVRHYMCRKYNLTLQDIPVRDAKEKAGPVITDNGNFIIDWKFKINKFKEYSSSDWKALANDIKLIPGVVETGLFADIIDMVYFGESSGNVIMRCVEKGNHLRF